MSENIGIINEQGDLGLFFNPLSDSEKKLYEGSYAKNGPEVTNPEDVVINEEKK